MTHMPTETRPLNGGTQEKYKFDNGYGASLIIGGFVAYGGREMAVLGQDGHPTYDTPITNDVIGHLSEADVQPLLDRIAALPKPATT